MNDYLKSLHKGLTAKVFRTWKASSEVTKALTNEIVNIKDSVCDKKSSYDKANLTAALVLNHKRLTDNAKKLATIDSKIVELQNSLAKSGLTAKRKIRIEQQIRAQNLKRKLADENVSLNTSKANYIDPRITVAWAKSFDVPLEKLMNQTMRENFIWAMETKSDWKF